MRRKEAIEQLLRMSKGREFQIAGAATEKLLGLEPKHVRTRGTDNRLARAVPDLLLRNPAGAGAGAELRYSPISYMYIKDHKREEVRGTVKRYA